MEILKQVQDDSLFDLGCAPHLWEKVGERLAPKTPALPAHRDVNRKDALGAFARLNRQASPLQLGHRLTDELSHLPEKTLDRVPEVEPLSIHETCQNRTRFASRLNDRHQLLL